MAFPMAVVVDTPKLCIQVLIVALEANISGH